MQGRSEGGYGGLHPPPEIRKNVISVVKNFFGKNSKFFAPTAGDIFIRILLFLIEKFIILPKKSEIFLATPLPT